MTFQARAWWIPCALYLAAGLLLIFPALVNQFPLVMGDTFRYLAEAAGTYSWVSSQFYSYVLGAFSGSSLWLMVFVQAALTVVVVSTFLRAICGISHDDAAVIVALLAVSSPLSLFVSLVMTDIMFGLGLVAGVTLLVGVRSLWSDLTMTATVAYSAAAHPAALPLLAGVVALAAVGLGVRRYQTGRWNGLARVGLLAASVALAAGALVINSTAIWDKPSPSPHSAVVAFAYLLSHGDLEDELAGCEQWRFCEVTERPRPGINSFNTFLFGRRGVLWEDLGGPKAFAEEAAEIVYEHATSDPVQYLRRAVSSGYDQLSQTRALSHVDWAMRRLNHGHSDIVAGFSRADVARFEAGSQFQGELDLERHEDAGILLGWLGAFVALAGGIGWIGNRLLHRPPWPLPVNRSIAAAVVLLGLYLMHALVIGTSTYPAHRYGGRVLWLLVLGLWAVVYAVVRRKTQVARDPVSAS